MDRVSCIWIWSATQDGTLQDAAIGAIQLVCWVEYVRQIYAMKHYNDKIDENTFQKGYE
jgi:hypothetical protein